MSRLTSKPDKNLINGLSLAPSESLWKRAPSRLDDGSPVSDFMVLIPGLNKRPQQEIHARYTKISATLCQFEKTVVFADLNLKLNILWISHKPVPNASIEITLALQALIPEAKLVGMKFD